MEDFIRSLVNNGQLSEIPDEECVQLLIIHPEVHDERNRFAQGSTSAEIIGYYKEQYIIDPEKIKKFIGELIKQKLTQLITKINDLELNRPDFTIESNYSSGVGEFLNFGKLVADFPKETEEQKRNREIFKQLVNTHNENLKKGRTFDNEIEYFVRVFQKIDRESDSNGCSKYLKYLKVFNKYNYDVIYQSPKYRKDIISKRINELISCRQISSWLKIDEHFDHDWMRSNCRVQIIPIKRIKGNEDFKADIVEHSDDREY